MKHFCQQYVTKLCWFSLGKIYDINMAYLGSNLIEKLNEMICLSAVVSTGWCSN